VCSEQKPPNGDNCREQFVLIVLACVASVWWVSQPTDHYESKGRVFESPRAHFPSSGGVPAVTPFDFSAASAPVINDFSCRFEDGSGAYLGITDSSYTCTKVPPTETYQFVGANTTIRFCGQISQATSFPVSDTVLAARLRDIYGNVSQVSSIVIRVPAP
jgi:hypothetical protein